jgi:hypothetical protein
MRRSYPTRLTSGGPGPGCWWHRRPSTCLAAVSAHTNYRIALWLHKGFFPYVSRILVVSVRHAKRPKRAGEAGTRQKPPDQAEPDPDGASGTHEPHEAGSASAVPAEVSAPTGKTTTGARGLRRAGGSPTTPSQSRRSRPRGKTRDRGRPDMSKRRTRRSRAPEAAGQGD